MSVRIDYTKETLKDVLDKICECGHVLSYHGFVDNIDYATNQHYLVVSICTFCDCKGFEEVI